MYKETYNEWVTHEVWFDAEHILFTIWPYDDEHKKAHGVAITDLHGDRKARCGVGAISAWHTHGSPDGKWVLGDDERNIWLIHMETGGWAATQGHLGKGRETHLHASFTRTAGDYLQFFKRRLRGHFLRALA